MSEAAEQTKPPSLGDVVGLLAFLIGLISAWLYAAGWTYAITISIASAFRC